MDLGGNTGDGEEWAYFEDIFRQSNPQNLLMENVECEGKGKIKDDSLVWLNRLTSKPSRCAEKQVLLYLTAVVMFVSES